MLWAPVAADRVFLCEQLTSAIIIYNRILKYKVLGAYYVKESRTTRAVGSFRPRGI